MMRYNICFVTIFLFWLNITGNSQNHERWNFGLEIDALPYLTKGHFIGFWLGKDQLRARVLTAKVNKPDWTTKSGFNNHRIKAYALVADYFPTKQWKKWWIGGGPVIWKSTIADASGIQSKPFHNFLINGSLGYNVSIGKNFYLSPWMGMSMNVGGDKSIPVGTAFYSLPFFNPEVSLKIGAYF